MTWKSRLRFFFYGNSAWGFLGRVCPLDPITRGPLHCGTRKIPQRPKPCTQTPGSLR